ncbi:MAG: CoA-binding protein [Raineya sp.]
MKKDTVLVLGASANPNRYAYLASQLLLKKGYKVALVGIRSGQIGELKIETDRSIILPHIDTITMYVGPKNQPEWYDYILQTQPRRIIFNPGTENTELSEKAQEKGIECIEACTLVMLQTGQF